MPNPQKSRDLVIGRKKKPVKPGPSKAPRTKRTKKPPNRRSFIVIKLQFNPQLRFYFPELGEQNTDKKPFIVAVAPSVGDRPRLTQDSGRLNVTRSRSGMVSDPRSEAVRVREFENESYYVEPKMPPDFCRPYPAKRIAENPMGVYL